MQTAAARYLRGLTQRASQHETQRRKNRRAPRHCRISLATRWHLDGEHAIADHAGCKTPCTTKLAPSSKGRHEKAQDKASDHTFKAREARAAHMSPVDKFPAAPVVAVSEKEVGR